MSEIAESIVEEDIVEEDMPEGEESEFDDSPVYAGVKKVHLTDDNDMQEKESSIPQVIATAEDEDEESDFEADEGFDEEGAFGASVRLPEESVSHSQSQHGQGLRDSKDGREVTFASSLEEKSPILEPETIGDAEVLNLDGDLEEQTGEFSLSKSHAFEVEVDLDVSGMRDADVDAN